MQNSKPRRLFLARHGESVANQQKLVCGQLDMPLTEKGRLQAQCLCDVLKTEKLSAIYTSSLSRAVETARPTADYHGIKIQALDNLKEIHFGVLQGKPAGETLTKETHIPGRETFPVFKQRIEACFETLLQSLPDSTLIVAHRNTNEVILCQLLGLGSSTHKTINVKNKYLYEIELGTTLSINTIRLGGEFHGKKFTGLKDE